METTYIFIAFGAFVWLFGIAMVAWHVQQHRAVVNDPGISPSEFKFHESQYRRRMQTSALTITLGAMITMWDYVPQLRTSIGIAAGYIATLLLLSVWLVLLAIGDAIASRVHMQQSMRRNRQTRAALQDAIDELRRQQDHTLKPNKDDLTINSSEWK